MGYFLPLPLCPRCREGKLPTGLPKELARPSPTSGNLHPWDQEADVSPPLRPGECPEVVEVGLWGGGGRAPKLECMSLPLGLAPMSPKQVADSLGSQAGNPTLRSPGNLLGEDRGHGK